MVAVSWPAAAVAPAANDVPAKIGDFRATPRTFCAKSGARCTHVGTVLHFTLSTPARMRIEIRPRFRNIMGYVEVVRRFPSGPSSVQLQDRRLTRGRWRFQAYATNDVATSSPAIVDVRIVRG